MTRKERNQKESICGSDISRLISNSMQKMGYEVTAKEVMAMLNILSELIYTCLINDVRVKIPNLGEFYRDVRKGRKAGYYNVPNSRDEHTKFDKNMTWTKEYMDKAPDFGRIMFNVMPKIKKQFKEETSSKV